MIPSATHVPLSLVFRAMIVNVERSSGQASPKGVTILSAPEEPPRTTRQISARMSRQRQRDTGPEVALRKILHARGWRFRVDAPLPGLPRRRADILFSRRRVAVFVDGCFWHVCPEHGTRPANNGPWWHAKLKRNVERDRETDTHLLNAEWQVVRCWEHTSADEAADVVESTLLDVRESSQE